jgi:hypothetical protein
VYVNVREACRLADEAAWRPAGPPTSWTDAEWDAFGASYAKHLAMQPGILEALWDPQRRRVEMRVDGDVPPEIENALLASLPKA